MALRIAREVVAPVFQLSLMQIISVEHSETAASLYYGPESVQAQATDTKWAERLLWQSLSGRRSDRHTHEVSGKIAKRPVEALVRREWRLRGS